MPRCQKSKSCHAKRTRVATALLAMGFFVMSLTPRTLASPAEQAQKGPKIAVENGWLTATRGGVTMLSRGAGLPVDVTIDDTPCLQGGNATVSTRRAPDGSWATHYVVARGELIERFAPFAALGKSAWRRSLTYRNRSVQSQDLTGAVMRLAPREYSRNWNPTWFWMAQNGGGAVHVAYQGTTDFYALSQTPDGIESRVQAAWRLKPGAQAFIGYQGVWLTKSGAANFRAEAQKWYRAIGIRVAPNKPAWLSRSVWYEASAGGGVESRFSDTGGFEAFSHQVDYLADLGVNSLWLNAVHQHKSLPDPQTGGWNHYAPLDFSKIDEISGGVAALQRLSRALKQGGIHIIGELVPHGATSVQANALPPWWTRNRDGKPSAAWGGRAMDLSSPPWQSVMRGASTRLARDFFNEGIRIDVADGQGENWGSPRTAQASYSTLAGSVEMLRSMRDGLKRGGATLPVMLPESGLDRPEHFALTPLSYGSPTTAIFATGLPADLSDAPEIARRLRTFFENERGSLPDGALVLRTLNNHDTVVDRGRVMQRFGVGLARALYGVCAVVPGVPMLYQEEETGSFEALRRLNFARRRVPEMGEGTPDYTSVKFAPEAFCVLRTLRSARASTRALALVNLSGKALIGRVKLPPRFALRDGTPVFDAVSGRRAAIFKNGFAWISAPYQTAILRLANAPEGALPPLRFRGENTLLHAAKNSQSASAKNASAKNASALKIEAAPDGVSWRVGALIARLRFPMGDASTRWTATREGNATRLCSANGEIILRPNGAATQVEITLKNGAPPPQIEVFGAEEWAVSGRTAWLQDRVLQRHFAFPAASHYLWKRTMVWGAAPWNVLYQGVLPVGRLWQSVLEPLHPSAPGFAFTDTSGGALVFSGVTSNAKNVVLTDRSDETPAASTRAGGLALRFYADDPDLNSRIAAFGPDAKQWQMENYPSRAGGVSRISFRVETARNALEKLRAAPRLPVLRSGVRETRVRGSYADFFDAVWLMEPGEIAWSGLAQVPGTFRIGLELRHSEVSAEGRDLDDAYRVLVDGVPQPLQWTQRNAASTGNAFFGLALTPPLDLAGRSHEIRIITARPWAAVRPHFHLVAP